MPKRVAPVPATPATASWMTTSLHLIGDKRVNQIAIPGTHNSTSYALCRASRYAADAPGLVKYRPPWPVSAIIAGWSRTQKRTILQQLNDGIRYFDIRVGHQRNEFYTCHGMNAETCKQLVETVVQFSESHTREVIILDFNHFYCMKPEDHDRLTQQLRDMIGANLWPAEDANLTLNEAFSKGRGPIIVVYHRQEGEKHGFFPRNAISAPWPNTDHLATLRGRLHDTLAAFDRESRQLFVSQLIFTPKVNTVMRGLKRCSHYTLLGLTRKLNDELTEWIYAFHKTRPLNIVLLDHYHTNNLAEMVINQNFASQEISLGVDVRGKGEGDVKEEGGKEVEKDIKEDTNK